ncbi:hypothetical protein J4231_03780 [Candidatus Woesearchaeota archaeon]|nr:hypothetical protein [Candidatus Woesearchaeota archaeon]
MVSTILSTLFIAYAARDRPPPPIFPRDYEIGSVHVSKTDVVRDMSVAVAVMVSCPLSVIYFRKKKMSEKAYHNLASISKIIYPNEKTIIENVACTNGQSFTGKIKYDKIVGCYEEDDSGNLELIIEVPRKFGWLGKRKETISIFSAEDPKNTYNKLNELIGKDFTHI